MLVEWALIRHLYRRPLDTLLATWGLSLILQQAYRSIFGAREVGVDLPDWMMGSLNLTDTIQIPINGLFVMVLTTLITVGRLSADFPHRLGQAGARGDVTIARWPAPSASTPSGSIASPSASAAASPGVAGSAFTMIGSTSPTAGQLYIVDTFLVVVFGGAAEPARHHRLRLHHLAGPLDAGVLPQRVDGAGARAARRGRHPDAAAAGPVRPQGAALRSAP